MTPAAGTNVIVSSAQYGTATYASPGLTADVAHRNATAACVDRMYSSDRRTGDVHTDHGSGPVLVNPGRVVHDGRVGEPAHAPVVERTASSR